MEEIWKPIEDLYGIEVSNKGNIRSFRKRGRGKTLHEVPKNLVLYSTPTMQYLVFKTTGVTRTVHREVAIAFVPNPLNLPEVNHLDEDPHNNAAWNLAWCTRRENNVYSFGKTVRVVDPHGEVRTFDSVSSLARAMDSNQGNVSRFVRGIRYKNGYKSWRIYFGE